MIKGGHSSSQTIAGREVRLNTGVLAKQANGSVTIQCGDMVLLATAVMSKSPKEGIDFFPLTIEFAEKMYAAGKIPGGFFKREARPSTNATLIARLIDRPLRPTFPKGFYNEVQIIITVLSYDPTVSIESLAITAASAAVSVSDIPFNGPIAGVVVGLIDGELVTNPSPAQLTRSKLNLTVAGTKDAILMIESEAKEVSESQILDAIMFGHEAIKQMIALQDNLVAQTKKEKKVIESNTTEADRLEQEIATFLGNRFELALTSPNSKQEIEDLFSSIEAEVKAAFVKEDDTELQKKAIEKAFQTVKKDQIRKTIITKKVRPDGRKTTEIRNIETQVSVLPSVHGSALFTRGETQSLCVVTLGDSKDEQMLDGLDDTQSSAYFFHYNFPPFSVGEVGRIGTGRRELGHGALAERALLAVLPTQDAFPYTIRIVSEILESNGSSSMASVCGGSMALMDCGVPIKAPVSGIAMGLLLDGNDYVILSDIQGLEDHYGDMDFKVAGTKEGITALQLDIKVSGLSREILENALNQANEGRLYILNKMAETLSISRESVSENAPKIETISINPEKVGLVIGPGGKMIRHIEEESGASVVVSDGNTGEVQISGKSGESVKTAKMMILRLTKEPEVGEIYDGKVTKIMQFGCFVELYPGKEGLIHISKLSDKRVENVEDIVKVGDRFEIKVDKIDDQKRINLVPTTKF